MQLITLRRVGVGATTTAEALDNVDEAAVVLDPALSAAGLLLLLLLLLNLRGLALDLTSTRQRTVHFTTNQWHGDVQLERAQGGHGSVITQSGTFAVQVELFGVEAMQLGKLVLPNENQTK